MNGEHSSNRASRWSGGRLRLVAGAATVGSLALVLTSAPDVAGGATPTTKKATTKASSKSSTPTTAKSSGNTTAKSTTKTTKAGSAPTTTADVRPVTETSSSVARSTPTPTPTSTPAAVTTTAPRSTRGPVFIPGAGRVLDLGANEVAKLASGGRVEMDVRGASGLAASGTGTVILDVTVSNPTTPGRVTLNPVAPEFARSVVQSSVAFPSGATTVSRVAVPVGASGLVRVATTAGPSGLAITVVGWVITAPAGSSEASAIPLETCRVLDTANGTGGLQGEVTPARPFDIPAVGIAKVPGALVASGPAPSSVILAVTGSAATGPLELRVVPTGGETPELKLFMNINQATAAHFVVPVGADARTAFYVSGGGTQIAVDVVGWLDRDNVARSGGPC